MFNEHWFKSLLNKFYNKFYKFYYKFYDKFYITEISVNVCGPKIQTIDYVYFYDFILILINYLNKIVQY